MTAQIPDMFRYNGSRYDVAGISGGDLFDPGSVGLEPVMASTACYRGYQAFYSIRDSHLVLHALNVRLAYLSSKKAPKIHGVKPFQPKENSYFNTRYMGLHVPIEYSGGVLIASGFIRGLYVHMGFHPAWKYKNVFELVFLDGILIKEEDRGNQMKDLRNKRQEKRDTEDIVQLSNAPSIEAILTKNIDS